MLDMSRYPEQNVRLDSIGLADKRFQCRTGLDEEAVKRLMESIKQFGQQNPVDLVDLQNGQKPVVMRGAHRCEALLRNKAETVLARMIPIGDLGPNPEEMGYNLSVIENVEHNSLKELEVFSICGRWYGRESKSISKISDDLKISRNMVRSYILIYDAGPEIQEAIHKGLLPIRKTAEYIKKGGGELGVPEGHPPADDSDKLQIDSEKQAKLLEALKSPNPAEAVKQLFAGADAQSQPNGFKIGVSAKGTSMVGHFPKGVTKTAVMKAAEDAWQKWEANQNSKTRPGGRPMPDPEALKAAKAKEKANKADITRITKKLASLKTAAREAEKGGLDPAAIIQHAINLKAQLKGLKPYSAKASDDKPASASKQETVTTSPVEPVPSTEPLAGRRQSPGGAGEDSAPSEALAKDGGEGDNKLFQLAISKGGRLAEMAKQSLELIKQIESGEVPVQVLPSLQKGYEQQITAKEYELAQPGAKTEELNIELGIIRAIIASIKKKLGQ